MHEPIDKGIKNIFEGSNIEVDGLFTDMMTVTWSTHHRMKISMYFKDYINLV